MPNTVFSAFILRHSSRKVSLRVLLLCFLESFHLLLLNRWDFGDLSGGLCQQRHCHTAELGRGLYRGHSGSPSGPWQGLLYYHHWQLHAQLLWHLAGGSVPHEEAHQRDPHHQTHRPGEGILVQHAIRLVETPIVKCKPSWQSGLAQIVS